MPLKSKQAATEFPRRLDSIKEEEEEVNVKNLDANTSSGVDKFQPKKYDENEGDEGDENKQHQTTSPNLVNQQIEQPNEDKESKREGGRNTSHKVIKYNMILFK